MSLGTFTLVRDEAPWIAAHILNVIPYVDEMVFYDGNSTDGTLEIIEAIQLENLDGYKIKVFKNQDPIDLKDAYVRMFNSCLRSLSTDLAWFLHPDMQVVDPARILDIKDSAAVALTTSIKSFAGEPGGPLLRIKGRQAAWKNIYRLRNPDLGAHYAGHYGAAEEDVYFREITGSKHVHHGANLDVYPYEIESSGIEVLHFSDVRPLSRRIGRMKSCLANQGYDEMMASRIAAMHPRVTLVSGPDHAGNPYEFVPAEYPEQMILDRAKYSHLERSPALV